MKLSRLDRFLLRVAPWIGVRYVAGRRLVGRRGSFLYETGWMRSLRDGQPCRPDGSPIPWMNYAVVALLDERLQGDLDVFEWGSGASTLYFASRARSVTSVEHDPAWYDRVSRGAPANVRVLLQACDTDGAYCRAIDREPRRYDLIVVDGRDRVNCLMHGLAALSERGVILLDDAQRERYAPAIDHARGLGFRALPLEGAKPLGNRVRRTVLLYRPGNCLGV